MGGPTREFFREVFEDGLRRIDDAGADHLVIGGQGTRILFGESLNEHEDIDVLIRIGDADRMLEVFSRAGYSTHRRDERWIYKVSRPDVTIDLIFRAGETLPLDDEHIARAVASNVDGLEVRVPAPEDLAVMKAIFDAPDRRGPWYGAVSILRRFPIDWDYLTARGLAHGTTRTLSLLLYAIDAGVDVPARALEKLGAAADLR